MKNIFLHIIPLKFNPKNLKKLTRCSLCLPLLMAAQLYALPSSSQISSIVINRNELTLNELIREIEQQTEYLFVYSKKDVDGNLKVKVSGREKNVREVLDAALEPTNLTYQFENNYISLSAKTAAQQAPQEGSRQTRRGGTVMDEQGQPMSGVTVIVKDTGAGSISDMEGYFTVTAQPGQIIQFSYLGYETTEREVPPADRNFKVIMTENIEEMDEVVVVGMGHQRRASVIGSISNINVGELKIPNRSLSNSFAGRLAGVVAVQRSGEPGYDNSSFWIRGISTFGANKTPLVLVDGVERVDAMNNLDPEEIASVSILKDASATAVYGVRAANGVVLITTRKGVASEKPSVELKMEYGLSQLTRMPQLLGGVDYMNLYNEAARSEIFSREMIEMTRSGADPYLYPNVNWFDEIFKKNSNNKNIAINVVGGGQVARYFVAFGFIDEHGNFRDNPANDYKSNISLQRYNFRSNVDVTLTKSTTLDIEVGGYLIDSHYPGTGTTSLFDLAYMANPINIPVKYPMGVDKDGNTNYVWAGNASASNKNPAERLLGSGFSTEFRNQFMGQVRLNQDFDKWVKGLSANAAFAFDAYSQTNIQRHKEESYYLANGRDGDGELELVQQTQGNEFLGYGRSVNSNRSVELKAQINYDRIFGERHRFSAMAMYYQRDYRNGNAERAILSLPYRKQGLAFRTTYSYDDRYFAEFNVGYNGSENFPKDDRFGLFPAGAIGYMISNESFWRNGGISRVISMLRLRGSVGLVGAEALPSTNDRFAYLTLVEGGLGGYNFGIENTGFGGTGENQLGIQHLTWEKGFKTNLGIEMDFFRRIVSLQVDLFHEKRSDILVNRTTIPGVVGLSAMPFANIGVMENKGVEGTLEINHNVGDFRYRVYANATFNKNEILEKDEAVKRYPYQSETGQMLGQQMGLIALGYFRDQDDISNSPAQKLGAYGPGDLKYMDVNGDGQVDSDDMVPIGYSDIPQVTYGFGVQLMYKGIDLGVFFRGQGRVSYMLGGEGFIPFKEGGMRGNLFEEALDRWTPENPRQDAFYPRLSMTPSNNNYMKSTKWMYTGNFLRLADVEIGYNFPRRWISRVGMEGLRVYFHGTNLAVFSKFKMWDPEIGKGRGDAYPLQRKYNFGLRFNF